jgi:hypothetical protein
MCAVALRTPTASIAQSARWIAQCNELSYAELLLIERTCRISVDNQHIAAQKPTDDETLTFSGNDLVLFVKDCHLVFDANTHAEEAMRTSPQANVM